MLRYCKAGVQQAALYRSDIPSSPDFDDLNSIDLVPDEIKAHGSDSWQSKDFSLVKDY